MKLYATMKSEKGKIVSKSSNDEIIITVTNDRKNIFDITFNGDTLQVMRYYDASVDTVEYIPQDKK